MSSSSSSSSSVNTNSTAWSNLESFLHTITPSLHSQSLPQSCIRGLNSLWQPLGKDVIEYFTLQDLWQCYHEWSAYGVGIPVVLESGQSIKQYYVPYLSAIQIYTNKSFVSFRHSKEDGDVTGFESETCSDESESDKLSRSLSNNSSRAWDATSDESVDQDGSCPMGDKLGYLYFQFCEYASPYWRIPLFDRITELARSYPGLLTLKSVELSPASWMAVAWYPIYQIPSQRNEKDLLTCFLTYHTLSSSFQDTAIEDGDNDGGKDNCCSEALQRIAKEKSKVNGCSGISLPPFGLSTYRMEGSLWLKPEASDHETMIYLHSAADCWLKQLSFDHHDHNFFVCHSTM